MIRERIGLGGMGVVYAAHEIELDREVAIKFLRFDQLATLDPVKRQDAVKRFECEARITSGLAHPCIPPVYAYGRLPDQTPYLVMKRIHGNTLHDLLREAGKPSEDISRLVQIFEQVCQAVGFAHDHGVIHRDLKPRNIMVGTFGEVQVMDWGIAKQLAIPDSGIASEGGLTVIGRAMGTPDYMPPEQAKGEWEQVDERADVFALGAILCTMLTGEPPYAWGTTSHHIGRVTDANLKQAIERLRTCERDAELVSIATACLAPDPRDRPPNGIAVARLVEEFRKGVAQRLQKVEVEKALAAEAARIELERIQAAAEAEVAAVKAPAKESRQRRRRLARLAAVALVGFALLAVAAMAWRQNHWLEQVNADAESAMQAREAGDRRKAITDYLKARDGCEGLLGGPLLWNRSRITFELAKINTRLAELHEEERNSAAAAVALTEAEQLLDKLREVGGRPEYDLALAEVYHNRGMHYGYKGDQDAALEQYRKGLSLRENVPEAIKRDPKFRRDLARSYGYLGDAQLEIGKFAQAAQSYRSAFKLREALAEENRDDADAQCLHARDFTNMANLLARIGSPEKLTEALAEHRKGLKYYAEHLAPLPAILPATYRTERANNYCEIAELELDHAKPAPDTATLIQAAKTEYDHLLGGVDELSSPPNIRAGLARVYVIQARFHHSRGEAPERDKAAAAAIRLLNRLDDEGKAQRTDVYHLAVAYVLLGESGSGDANRVLALDRLGKAIRKGFRDTRRLERDRCLANILKQDPLSKIRFEELVGTMPKWTATVTEE